MAESLQNSHTKILRKVYLIFDGKMYSPVKCNGIKTHCFRLSLLPVTVRREIGDCLLRFFVML